MGIIGYIIVSILSIIIYESINNFIYGKRFNKKDLQQSYLNGYKQGTDDTVGFVTEKLK